MDGDACILSNGKTNELIDNGDYYIVGNPGLGNDYFTFSTSGIYVPNVSSASSACQNLGLTLPDHNTLQNLFISLENQYGLKSTGVYWVTNGYGLDVARTSNYGHTGQPSSWGVSNLPAVCIKAKN